MHPVRPIAHERRRVSLREISETPGETTRVPIRLRRRGSASATTTRESPRLASASASTDRRRSPAHPGPRVLVERTRIDAGSRGGRKIESPPRATEDASASTCWPRSSSILRRVLPSRECVRRCRGSRNAPCAARRERAFDDARARGARGFRTTARRRRPRGPWRARRTARRGRRGRRGSRSRGAHGEMDVGDQPRGRRVGGGCVGVAVRARGGRSFARPPRRWHHEASWFTAVNAAHERVGRAATSRRSAADLGLTPLPSPICTCGGGRIRRARRGASGTTPGKLVGRVRAGDLRGINAPERGGFRTRALMSLDPSSPPRRIHQTSGARGAGE